MKGARFILFTHVLLEALSFFLSAFSLFLRFTFLLFWLVKACRNWTELNLFSNSKILRKIFTIPLSYLYDDRSVYQLTRITKLRYETKIKFVKKKKKKWARKKISKHHNNLVWRSAFRAPSGINYKPSANTVDASLINRLKQSYCRYLTEVPFN